MPARVRVCVFLNLCDQFYQREGEYREGTKFVVKPSFVIDRREAITMSEQAGLVLVERLRKLGVKPWLEDVETQRRIDPPNATTTNFTEDNRVPMRASLDDQNFFAVRPANTVEGPRWFVRCVVPGRPEPDVIYGETILGALQRALDLNFLQHGERAPAPEPQAPATRNSAGVVRRRPGDQFNA